MDRYIENLIATYGHTIAPIVISTSFWGLLAWRHWLSEAEVLSVARNVVLVAWFIYTPICAGVLTAIQKVADKKEKE